MDLDEIKTESEKAASRDAIPDDIRNIPWLAPLCNGPCYVLIPRLTDAELGAVNAAIVALKTTGSDGKDIASIVFRALADMIGLKALETMTGQDQSANQQDLVTILSDLTQAAIGQATSSGEVFH